MPAVTTSFLRPTAPTAADALLPGDPGRALALAQELLAEPRMSNHHHGLWGYYGQTEDGRPLTIQATGIGGPSATVVVRDLAALGVRRAVRLGTCVGRDRGLELGEALVVERALCGDGTSRALGASVSADPDPRLADALREEVAPLTRAVTVLSVDLPPDANGGPPASGVPVGEADAVELVTAPLFQLGRQLGIAIACALIVVADADHEMIDHGTREKVEQRIAAAAARALR